MEGEKRKGGTEEQVGSPPKKSKRESLFFFSSLDTPRREKFSRVEKLKVLLPLRDCVSILCDFLGTGYLSCEPKHQELFSSKLKELAEIGSKLLEKRYIDTDQYNSSNAEGILQTVRNLFFVLFCFILDQHQK